MNIKEIHPKNHTSDVDDSRDVSKDYGQGDKFKKTLEQKGNQKNAPTHKPDMKKQNDERKESFTHHRGGVFVSGFQNIVFKLAQTSEKTSVVRVPELVTKVIESLKVMRTKNLSRVDIELNLGKFGMGKVALVQKNESGLTINIQLSNHEAFDAFKSSAGELARGLLEKGVQIAEIQVQMPDGATFRLEAGSFESPDKSTYQHDESSGNRGQESEHKDENKNHDEQEDEQ